MNRTDFQELARTRLAEAQALLAQGHFSGAYYLAGYAVECGLKACIAKKTRPHDFPPGPKEIQAIYTHDLGKLVKSAGLELTLADCMTEDREFGTNWAVVRGWKEDSRYDARSEQGARDILAAIDNDEHGVLQWVSRYW